MTSGEENKKGPVALKLLRRKTDLLKEHIAEEERRDPPPLAVVRETVEHLWDAKLEDKLGEAVNKAGGSRKYTISLSTLESGQYCFRVLRQQCPITSLDFCCHDTHFDTDGKSTCEQAINIPGYLMEISPSRSRSQQTMLLCAVF
jgi:hypothetical protein